MTSKFLDMLAGSPTPLLSDGAMGTMLMRAGAAHGGHRLEDLAMLSLFGAPHLAEILTGYERAHALPTGWREDVPVHQLFGLLAHVALFGDAYVAPTRAAARAATATCRRSSPARPSTGQVMTRATSPLHPAIASVHCMSETSPTYPGARLRLPSASQ